MSAAVIAETPVGFRTWARPGACNTSTNAVSAPHRALYARDFMNPSSVSTVYGGFRVSAYGTGASEATGPRHGLHGRRGKSRATEDTDGTEKDRATEHTTP